MTRVYIKETSIHTMYLLFRLVLQSHSHCSMCTGTFPHPRSPMVQYTAPQSTLRTHHQTFSTKVNQRRMTRHETAGGGTATDGAPTRSVPGVRRRVRLRRVHLPRSQPLLVIRGVEPGEVVASPPEAREAAPPARDSQQRGCRCHRSSRSSRRLLRRLPRRSRLAPASVPPRLDRSIRGG